MEIWKDVKGYEGVYQVSNLGRVRSLERFVPRSNGLQKVKEKVLKLGTDTKGYYLVSLHKNKKATTKKVHRLVAFAFIINKDKKLCVNHINGIKTDNRVDNLEWATYSENNKHAFKTGLQCNKGEKGPRAKLTKKQVLEIRKMYSKKNITQNELSKIFLVSRSCIQHILNNKTWL